MTPARNSTHFLFDEKGKSPQDAIKSEWLNQDAFAQPSEAQEREKSLWDS